MLGGEGDADPNGFKIEKRDRTEELEIVNQPKKVEKLLAS